MRDSIAHGGGQSLGYSSLQQYFDVSKIVVARIEEAIR